MSKTGLVSRSPTLLTGKEWRMSRRAVTYALVLPAFKSVGYFCTSTICVILELCLLVSQ